MNYPAGPTVSSSHVASQTTGQSGNHASQQATVPNPPKGIANNPVGQLLNAVTMSKNDGGTLSVQIGQTVLTLKTAANPPVGTQLTLQVQSQSPQMLLQILGQGGAAKAMGGQGAQGTSSSSGLPVISTGGIVSGTMLSTANVPGGSLPGTPSATPHIGGQTAQPGATTGQGTPQSSASGQAAAGALAKGLQQAGGQGQNTAMPPSMKSMPAQSHWSLRVAGVSVPQSGAAPLPSLSPNGAPLLLATVTGQQNGQAILQFGGGQMVLQAKGNLPLGTRLALEPLSQLPRGAGPLAPLGDASRALSMLSKGYPELQDLLSSLTTVSPNSAAQLQSTIPQPNAQLTTTMLFFMAALRSGDVRNFLSGNSLRDLQRMGKMSLETVGKLGDRFADISRLASETPAGQWKAFPLPLFDGQQMQQINFFIRDMPDSEAGAEGDTAKGTRFVVEFNLTNMGEMQIDGLVKEKRFDLIMRSVQTLSKPVRDHITNLFQEANEITGFKGAIAFQKVKAFPVSPLEELTRQGRQFGGAVEQVIA